MREAAGSTVDPGSDSGAVSGAVFGVPSQGLTHFAAFYRGDDEYLDTVVPFILDGLANDDSVQIAVPTANLTLLRDALGDAAETVQWSDMTEIGRNPARTFAMFAAALRALPPGSQVRSVAEPVWPGRSADEYPACVQNEALFNVAFADDQLVTLCPYDAANLPAQVIADARRTHPLIRQGVALVPSREYTWRDAFDDSNTVLVSDRSATVLRCTQLTDLGAARTFAANCAGVLGLPGDRIGDLNLIVTELATNSLKYTGGDCRLALWKRDGHLICEVRDGGHLDDPLAGRRTASPHSLGGRGLLLVNALADLVRMHTSHNGTTIQVFLSLNPAQEQLT
jgi:anti-sigma regulatory factor (Ser/Thr protein kinase)